jgi:ribonuclease HI
MVRAAPDRFVLNFDGASRHNPHGPAGCGWVLYQRFRGSLKEVEHGNVYLGYDVSNNQAEYEGLKAGLQAVLNKFYDEYDFMNSDDLNVKLKVRGDSKIVICQMTGDFQMRSDNLKSLYTDACDLRDEIERHFGTVTFQRVDREDNKEADDLARRAVDEGY